MEQNSTKEPKIYKYKVSIKEDFLNVRSTPEHPEDDSNIIGRIPRGNEVETFGKVNGYLKIRFGKQDAYVLASKLRRV